MVTCLELTQWHFSVTCVTGGGCCSGCNHWFVNNSIGMGKIVYQIIQFIGALSRLDLV